MKKLSKAILLVTFLVGIVFPSWGQASTEGSDFWVTFLQADQDPNHKLKLELTITSRTNCSVTIENPFTTYSQTEKVTAGQSKTITLYTGDVRVTQARNTMNNTGKVCYAVYSEQVDKCALHVTAKDDSGKPAKISLFASNYKQATFDATNVLPTASLRDEYIVQTYTPSDHNPGDNSPAQGSHFAIVAAEDGVVVDYWPTVATTGHTANTKVTTPTLQKGQVWYVWTGKKDGDNGDLSGTRVIARDGKRIAVFQGCPHTNIPYKIKQRDHIFSQAMPVSYWGSNFVLTASKERKKDIIRILALYDNTQVYINEDLVHTFNFTNDDPKQYWEFVIGEKGDFAENGSCYLTTSCPCAVHLFMASQEFDGVSNGDPAMLWVNPIEQRIDQITFATYNSSNGTTQHYTNIVTDKPNLMTLDGNSIASEFKPVNGNADYSYAQLSLGTDATSHTLKSNGSTFIAHVYGFTDNESYGYSAGSATVGREITVNDFPFKSGEEATSIADAPIFCMSDSLVYDLNNISGSIYRIKLDFGDGTGMDSTKISNGSDEDEPFNISVKHAYHASGWYDASAIVFGKEFCTQPAFTDTIPIIFRVDRPDTLYRNVTLCADSVPKYHFDEIPNSHPPFAMQDPTVDEIIVATITSDGDCSNVYILTINAVSQRLDTIDLDKVYPIAQRRDSALIPADGYDTGEGLGLYHPTAEYVYTGGYYVRHYYRSNTKCDSAVTYHVTVVKCLDLKAENTQQTVCYMDSIHNLEFSYDRDGNPGSMDLWIDGKKNCPIIFKYRKDSVSRIHISAFAVPDKVYPGYHKAVIKMKDINCDTIAESEPFNLTVLYPDSIFAYKFDNVLTMYKKGHGGNIPGWDFVRYEWYHNDDTIPCGTGPVYHTDEPFTIGDTYYVVLTRTDGMVLRSCEFEIQDHGGIERSGKGNAPDSDGNDTGNMPAANAPAKFIQNRQLYILFEGAVYNMYGQRVKSND